jgi:Tfp pilus assembly protein FimV
MVMVMLSLHLALAGSVWAFAVGDIAVQSRRGEPFAAQIRLLLNARERDKEVVVTFGTSEDYRTEGFKRPAFSDVLRAVVSNTRDSIRVTSTVALLEPTFHLVLSVRAGQLTIVKHYQVTLPPPAPATVQTPPAPAAVAQAASIVPTPKPTIKPPRIAHRSRRYGPVERGETLYSVVRSLRIPSDRIWQAAVVLWQTNKSHFHGGNLHGLPVGTILDIPTDFAEQIAAIRLGEAEELVATQWEEWHLAQRAGLGKPRVVTAAREAEPAEEAPAHSPAAPQVAEPAPAEKKPEATLPKQAMVLPMGQPGSMVSVADLQTALQGLEDRLMQRMTPTTHGQPQELKAPTALVNALDLQTSIQSLEERLTQRMQHLITQTTEPVQIGPRVAQAPAAVGPASAVAEHTQSMLLVLLPYVIVLTNVLLLCLGGGLVWLWLRRRDRAERMQRI